jgi:hypothetical protein
LKCDAQSIAPFFPLLASIPADYMDAYDIVAGLLEKGGRY